MKVLIIDGQGGGLGRQLVAAVKERFPEIEVLAGGRKQHSYRCHAPCRADQAATGENAVLVASRRADVIMGPIGIVIADAMLGEITPVMAAAAGQSEAKRILLPVGQCDNIIAGVRDMPMAKMVQEAVELLAGWV